MMQCQQIYHGKWGCSRNEGHTGDCYLKALPKQRAKVQPVVEPEVEESRAEQKPRSKFHGMSREQVDELIEKRATELAEKKFARRLELDRRNCEIFETWITPVVHQPTYGKEGVAEWLTQRGEDGQRLDPNDPRVQFHAIVTYKVLRLHALSTSPLAEQG